MRFSFRKLLAMIVTVLCFSAVATAQDQKADEKQTLRDTELKNYCIYADRYYSIGSYLCEGGTANRCSAPNNKEHKTAYWANETSPTCNTKYTK